MTDTWTLTTLNCNGLRAAVRKGFHQWRPKDNPDVICMQELRLQAEQVDKEHRPPRGWKSVQADAVKKGYAGTAVWSRLAPLATSIGCGLDWADEQGRISRMDLAQASVISVYLPSGSAGEEAQARKDAFCAYFLDWTAGLLAEGRPMVLCGDLNIAHTPLDIWNPGANKKNSGFLPHEREWFSRLLDQGWVDVWRRLNPDAKAYSWWSSRGQAREKDRGWRLDYQLATPDLADKAVGSSINSKVALSDHAPVNISYRY